MTVAYGYILNACAHMTGGCAMAWAKTIGNIVGGGFSVAGGISVCSTGIGCLAGAPAVAVGVGSIGEGLDWMRAGDENVEGQNVVKNSFKNTLTSFGATDTSANLAYGAVELGSAGLALKAPISMAEKMWTPYGVQATDGLKITVPAIAGERFREWATYKPFADFAKSTYDALTGK